MRTLKCLKLQLDLLTLKILKEYQVKAVSQGKDALAKVTVKVEFKDEGTIIGRGLDVDTMLASAKAYVAALNTYLDAKR